VSPRGDGDQKGTTGRRGHSDGAPYQIVAQSYAEYLPRVLNYMRLRVEGETLAQDLTAQTFERAVSRLHTLRDERAFGGWLFSIARSVVAGYYRSHHGTVSLESIEERVVVEVSVESRLIHSEELDALREALHLLSEREQEIIRLKFVAGLTNRAIGKAMGLREGNVAVILYRALRKLRRTMQHTLLPQRRRQATE
jgi:RNA polymerase sigma factor (sigma-70 family)